MKELNFEKHTGYDLCKGFRICNCEEDRFKRKAKKWDTAIIDETESEIAINESHSRMKLL